MPSFIKVCLWDPQDYLAVGEQTIAGERVFLVWSSNTILMSLFSGSFGDGERYFQILMSYFYSISFTVTFSFKGWCMKFGVLHIPTTHVTSFWERKPWSGSTNYISATSAATLWPLNSILLPCLLLWPQVDSFCALTCLTICIQGHQKVKNRQEGSFVHTSQKKVVLWLHGSTWLQTGERLMETDESVGI